MNILGKSIIYSTCLLFSALAFAQQKVKLVNDSGKSDSDVYVLVFAGGQSGFTQVGETTSLPGSYSTSASYHGLLSANSEQKQTTQPKTLTLSISAPLLAPQNQSFPVQFLGRDVGVTFQATWQSVSGVNQMTITVPSGVTLELIPISVGGTTTDYYYFLANDAFVYGVVGQPLSSFPKSTESYSSHLSGSTSLDIYEVDAYIEGGIIYISYDSPLVYMNGNAPKFGDKTNFQTVEINTAAAPVVANLTAIDYFSIPLQLDTVSKTKSHNEYVVLDQRTYYMSRDTIYSQLESVGATKQTSITSTDYFTFLSPVHTQSNFMDFASYLSTLKDKDFSIYYANAGYGVPNPAIVFGVNAAQNFSATYNYQDVTVSEDSTSYTIKMTGTNTISPLPGVGNEIIGYFPTENKTQIDITLPKTGTPNYNDIIYGSTLNADSFSVQIWNSSTSAYGPITLPQIFGDQTFTVKSISSTATTTTLAFDTNFTTSYLNTNAAGLILYPKTGGGFATVTKLKDATAGNGEMEFEYAVTDTANFQAGDAFYVGFSFGGISNTLNTQFTCPQLQNLNYIPVFDITFLTGAQAGNKFKVVSENGGNFTIQDSFPSKNPPVPNDIFYVTVEGGHLFTHLYTNSSYAQAVGDVLAGLNFGFVEPDSNSYFWYTKFPQDYPYGLAQPTTGYYNAWSAVIYNVSDAYGFGLGDRIHPSPLISVDSSTQDFWITMLPANQLDAPLVNATAPANSNGELQLSWTADTSLTYTIETTPANPAGAITVNPTSTAATQTISNLIPGVEYGINVQSSNATQMSKVLPVYATPSGSVTAYPYLEQTGNGQTGYAVFGLTINWFQEDPLAKDNYILRMNVKDAAGNDWTDIPMSGATASTGQFFLPAQNGENVYVIQVWTYDSTSKTRLELMHTAILEMDVTNMGGAVGGQTNWPSSFTIPNTTTSAFTVYGSSDTINNYIVSNASVGTFNYQQGTPKYSLAATLNLSPIIKKKFAAVKKITSKQNQPVEDKLAPLIEVDRRGIFNQQSSPVKITGRVSDDRSLGVVQYSLDGETWGNVGLAGEFYSPSGLGSRNQFVESAWELNLDDLEPGRHLVRFRAIDESGKVSRPKLYGVIVTNSAAPLIAVNGVAVQEAFAGMRYTVSGVAYDDEQVAFVQFSLNDGKTWRRARTSPSGAGVDWECLFIDRTGSQGSILVRAIDKARNPSDAVSIDL